MIKHIHFIGIGGSGASAVAQIAKAYGYQVSGCDIASDSPYLKKVKGISIETGHSPDHLKRVDLLVISPAILKFDPGNHEALKAEKKSIPILTWQEFMAKFLQKDKFVIAASGTHGKSTITAMIGHILEEADLDPTVEIGAIDLEWKTNFRIGKSKYFVCEADEYNNNFLHYKPAIAVISNIEWDHPDFFKNEVEVFESFTKFIKYNSKLKSLIVNPKELGITKFITQYLGKRKSEQFLKLVNLRYKKLKLAGEHNLINANIAAAVGEKLGITQKNIKKSLEIFEGLERRFEYKGALGSIKIYEDFAHHPTELKALFEAIEKRFKNKRIWFVFQPHTFSRTLAFFDDFAKVFKDSNLQKIIITDIFAARERKDLSISSQKLADAIGNKAQYTGTNSQVLDVIANNKNKIDLLFIVGAGDIYNLTNQFLKRNG